MCGVEQRPGNSNHWEIIPYGRTAPLCRLTHMHNFAPSERNDFLQWPHVHLWCQVSEAHITIPLCGFATISLSIGFSMLTHKSDGDGESLMIIPDQSALWQCGGSSFICQGFIWVIYSMQGSARALCTQQAHGCTGARPSMSWYSLSCKEACWHLPSAALTRPTVLVSMKVVTWSVRNSWKHPWGRDRRSRAS